MKYIIVAAWILAVVDAQGLILKENGTECKVDHDVACARNQNKFFSYDSTCEEYVECISAGFMISSCWGDKKFDEKTRQCVSFNEDETPVCHPCDGYPPIIWEESDCPLDCKVNLGKNISHRFDCTVYKQCTTETSITFESCPDGQKFSDAAGACIEPPEGSGPTCHPCRSWEQPSAQAQISSNDAEEPIDSGASAEGHGRVDLTKTIVFMFITMMALEY